MTLGSATWAFGELFVRFELFLKLWKLFGLFELFDAGEAGEAVYFDLESGTRDVTFMNRIFLKRSDFTESIKKSTSLLTEKKHKAATQQRSNAATAQRRESGESW